MKILIYLCALSAMIMADELETVFDKGNDKFTAKFFTEIVKQYPEKSVIMSAFSVLQPLAQLSLASVGESHDEILSVIGLPNDNATKTVFPLVDEKLRAVKGIVLKQANRVYIPLGLELNEDFQSESKKAFGSEITNADFSNSLQAAKDINTWIEDQTNNRITDLISPADISPTTKMILVNAIYFKGTWEQPFDKMNTEDRGFHLNKDTTVQVPTMYKFGTYKYGESKELNAKLLELFYEGFESSFLIVLPNEIDGIIEIQKKLKDLSVLDAAIDDMFSRKVHVYIPKFKTETTTDLKNVLQSVGIQKLFSSEARLDKLVKGHINLQVSAAIQKAFIEVDEQGAEAAAANAFVLAGSSFVMNPPPEYYFRADRPFYYELRAKSKRLFNGVYYQ